MIRFLRRVTKTYRACWSCYVHPGQYWQSNLLQDLSVVYPSVFSKQIIRFLWPATWKMRNVYGGRAWNTTVMGRAGYSGLWYLKPVQCRLYEASLLFCCESAKLRALIYVARRILMPQLLLRYSLYAYVAASIHSLQLIFVHIGYVAARFHMLQCTVWILHVL